MPRLGRVTQATQVTRRVPTSDGLELAVQETGDPAHPTVVLVHGFPDDHTVWDGVVPLLAADHHVVTYDVRGAGASDAPKRTSGYRIPRLIDDLAAVIDAVSPGEPVHLIGHDWGSIQSWHAVADPSVAARLRSFTSISGPHLDMAAAWLRGVRHHPLATAGQVLHSSYIAAFQVPVVPELAVATGLINRVVPGPERPSRDLRNGFGLYRANMLGRLARPRPERVTVPVQVIAPEGDAYVGSRMQREAPAPYVEHLLTHRIDGDHWVVVKDPDAIVRRFLDFTSYAEYVTSAGRRT